MADLEGIHAEFQGMTSFLQDLFQAPIPSSPVTTLNIIHADGDASVSGGEGSRSLGSESEVESDGMTIASSSTMRESSGGDTVEQDGSSGSDGEEKTSLGSEDEVMTSISSSTLQESSGGDTIEQEDSSGSDGEERMSRDMERGDEEESIIISSSPSALSKEGSGGDSIQQDDSSSELESRMSMESEDEIERETVVQNKELPRRRKVLRSLKDAKSIQRDDSDSDADPESRTSGEGKDEIEREPIIRNKSSRSRRPKAPRSPIDSTRRSKYGDMMRAERRRLDKERASKFRIEPYYSGTDTDTSESWSEEDGDSDEVVFAGPRHEADPQSVLLDAAVHKFEKDLDAGRKSGTGPKRPSMAPGVAPDDSLRPSFGSLKRCQPNEVEEVEEPNPGPKALNLVAKYVRAFDDSKIQATPPDLLDAAQEAMDFWGEKIKKQKLYAVPITPEKKRRRSASPQSTPTRKKRKIIRIPRTSPLAKRFQAMRKRRESQEFDIFEDPPSPPAKDPKFFDLNLLDTWIETERAWHRERMCISAPDEQREEFRTFEGIAVELHKLQNVKRWEDGRLKSFDVEVLEELLKSRAGDEFVRINFAEPLEVSIESGILFDGDNDVVV